MLKLKINANKIVGKNTLLKSKISYDKVYKINYKTKHSNILNMEDIQKVFVPIIKNVDVFISYDHKDFRKASIIASILKNEGFKVF